MAWNKLDISVLGMSYFGILILEKYVIKPEEFTNKFCIYLYQVISLLSVVILWIFFRSDSLNRAEMMLCSLLGLNGNPFIDKAFIFNGIGDFYGKMEEAMVFSL